MTHSVAAIRAKLNAHEVVTSDEVCWLVETLEGVAALVCGGSSDGAAGEFAITGSAGRRDAGHPGEALSQGALADATVDEVTPTNEELAAEFGLGPNPSSDMLAYLRQFVRDRAAAEWDD